MNLNDILEPGEEEVTQNIHHLPFQNKVLQCYRVY
jgi:hypothetical protein